MDFLIVLASFFILYELIKAKNELVELNNTIKSLKDIIEKYVNK